MTCTLAFLGDCMAGIGLKEAAKLTGKNQSTIHRAMKNNKLAFTLDDSGQRLIDPAELDRWNADNPTRFDGSNALHDDAAQRIGIVQLQAQLEEMANYPVIPFSEGSKLAVV